jgi:hypothetical protein
MNPLLFSVLGNLLDRILPDPKASAEAKLKVMEMAQAGELAQLDAEVKLATGQIEVNKVEAASEGAFTRNWRPFVGWTCGVALAFKFIGGPSAVVLMAMLGHPITLPEFDFSEMSTILIGMLGLGTLRSVEKIKGATK